MTAEEVIAFATSMPGVVPFATRSPAAGRDDVDHSERDRILPHPVYAAQS